MMATGWAEGTEEIDREWLSQLVVVELGGCGRPEPEPQGDEGEDEHDRPTQEFPLGEIHELLAHERAAHRRGE